MEYTKNTQKQLNKKQQEAVCSNHPATMVIAGPGTGKTEMLASRIVYLVREQKIDPENILALTFTESGANSMRERVILFLGTPGYKVNIKTFHSFASEVISENPHEFGYKTDARSAAEIDQAKIIREVIDELHRKGELDKLTHRNDKYGEAKNILSAIQDLKKEGIPPEEFKLIVDKWKEEHKNMPDEQKLSSRGPTKGQPKREYKEEEKRIERNKELVQVYKKYQEKLDKYNLYDYEDMILKAHAGLKNNDDLREKIQEGYKAILVDEYQDTSGSQNKLLFEVINTEDPNIFIVGDDDQAIYRFQGATIENFSEFLSRFPGANIISLEENYRSSQLLLNSALNIANKNPNRATKELDIEEKRLTAKGQHKDSREFYIHSFETELEEYAYIIEKINELRKKGAEWEDIAILTRGNKEQYEFAETLRRHDIPATISASRDALQEIHVNALFAFAQTLSSPNNDEGMLHFLLHPATPVKPENAWKLFSERKRDETLYQAMQRVCSQENEKSTTGTEAIKETYELINQLSSSQTEKTGAQWLNMVLQKSGLMEYVLKKKEASYIIANLLAVTDEAKRIQAGKPEMNIKDILDHFDTYRRLEIPLKAPMSNFTFENTVQIMTAHNAKGQEFENVFIIHAIDTNWSNKRGGRRFSLPPAVPSQKEDENDARRLFYVALTRTKKNLFVTYSETYTRGIDNMSDRPKSASKASYIEELSEETPVKKIKKDTKDILIKAIEEPKEPNEIQLQVVKNVVTSPGFNLNPTSLNSFLECPNKFLYEKVLRAPTIPTYSLTYGNAVHEALYLYFKTPEKERGLEKLIQFFNDYIERKSTLTKDENRKMQRHGKKSLENYYEKHLKHEKEPLLLEHNLHWHNPEENNIRLSGKIDKISQVDKDYVQVVDYKTSKRAPTENNVLGKTKTNDRTSELRQLLFYKLLAEKNEEFKYTPVKFTLDYVDADKQLDIPLEEEKYKSFQKTVKEVWNGIQSLEFIKNTKKFPYCKECRYCKIES